MSSGCGDVLSLADLQTAKKHQIFEAEVITGKQGGVASGADIDYATNQVTGQVQKTLPAVLRDAGFRPAPFTFTTGGTLTVNDADMAVLWPIADGGDGNYYAWKGALPKVIPANSTPATTGGVSDSAWSPISDKELRAELATDAGAGLSGFSDAENYSEGTVGAALKSDTFRREIIHKLPFHFSGYDTALAAMGSPPYIYPQGADYDDDGNLFVNYVSPNGGATRVIVVYSPAGLELTWFYAPNSSGQSVAVYGGGATRRLYDRRLGDDVVYYYPLASLPGTGGTLTGHVATSIQSAGSHLCVANDLIFCTLNAVPIGSTQNQTVINVYDRLTGEKKGTINVSQMLTGFSTPELSPNYYYKVWKIQGLSFKNGLLHIAVGGSYRPAFDDAKNAVHDYGVLRVNMQGELIDHSVTKADGLMADLAAEGCVVSRTESEGCFLHPDGSIHSILIGDLVETLPSTPNGIVILREFSGTGFSSKNHASGFCPLPTYGFNRIMRAEGGLLKDPVLGTTFTTVTQILDMVTSLNVTEFTWFSTIAPGLTPITGMPYLPSQMYRVTNVNNTTLMVESFGLTVGYEVYSVNGTLGAWTATKRNISAPKLNLNAGGAPSQLTYTASTGQEVGLAQINYTGASTPLVIGTGGALNPTAIFMFTNPTPTSTSGGIQSLQVYNSAVLPGANSAQTLGSSAFKWTQVYADSGTINTSDARSKVDVVELDAAEKRVAKVLKGLIRRYKMKNAVESKGFNSARYHIGIIAQEVEKAFADAGLNGFDYGILCYDEWGDSEAEYDADGRVLREACRAGNGYSIRYEELLCFIIAAM